MKTAFINGIILDGTLDMKPLEGYTILVNNEKIEDIVKDNNNLEGYKIIDLQGKYIMPGLINMHVHLPSSGRPKKKPSDPVKMVKVLTSNALFRRIVLSVCEGLAKTELRSGVTTIRTVGGVIDVDTKIRDRINSGKVVGPRVLASNMAISVPGGHMANSLAYPASNEEEARMYVDRIASEHVDLIKLMITGGVLDAKVKGEPGVLKMKPSIVKACCDEAHKHGLIVAAHVESPEGVKVALENGVDTIEHGSKLTPEMINLFKERKAIHVCTLSPALPFALFDRSISNVDEMGQYNGNIVFEGVIDCAKKCLENNIPVALGTDTGCPFVTHYDMWRELCYFKKYCGVSSTFALYSATLGNAKIAGIDKFTGSIEKGKDADLIVTEKNPLEDLTTLRNVKMVMARGNLIKNPKVKKMKNVEQVLDKYLN